MLGETGVGLLVALEYLLLAALHAAIDVLLIAIGRLVQSLHYEEVALVAHHLRVYRVGGALAERQVIDGIQQVGLAHAVLPDEAVHVGRKLEVGLLDVLIVEYGESFQNHYEVRMNREDTNILLKKGGEKRKTICRKKKYG